MRALIFRLLVALSLILFFGLALDAARQKSPTSDEMIHLTRGYSLWQTGSFRLQAGHPPLSHWLIGSLLLSGSRVPDVTQLNNWSRQSRSSLAAELFWEQGLDFEQMLLLGRIPIIWLGLLLGAMVARWSREQTTRVDAAIVTVLYAISPNLLASAALATTDMAATATYFAALFAFWCYWRRPGLGYWLLTAIATGLGLAVKLTDVLLLPLLFALGYGQWRPGKPWWRPGLIWLSLIPIVGLTLWSAYRFEVGLWPGSEWLVPAASYVRSWETVLQHVERGHRTFLLGQSSAEGWWYYFIFALILKTPPFTLFLALLSLGLFALRRQQWRSGLFVWLPPTAVLLAASTSGLNIGYRHILPAVPFLLLAAATSVSFLRRQRHLTRGVLGLGVAWTLIMTLRQQPHQLAYFSELVGGSARGYRFLGDSNLDWGQDLKLLAEYAARNPALTAVAYNGSGNPAYYGLTAPSLLPERNGPLPFAAANPDPGLYAVSVSLLQGSFVEPDLFSWFRQQQPIDHLGYSIFIYDVHEQLEGEWVAHCTRPDPVISPDTATQLLGTADLRNLYFDCDQSWIFPSQGAPGWFVVPLQTEPLWIARHLTEEAGLQLVYSHRRDGRDGAYAVYYWPGYATIDGALKIPAAAVVASGDNETTDLPVVVAETVELVGYDHDGDNWWLLWQVQAPTSEQLSFQAHLYPATGEPLVGDALGFSSEQWRPGDVLVQQHHFENAEQDDFLETGLYNYLTGERFGPRLRLPR